MIILLSLALMAPSATLAQACPELPPRAQERHALLDDLAMSPDITSGQRAASKLWEFWMTAPDEKAQFMLDDGMSRRSQFALVDAEIILDALTTYCPNYAEGWNQRAFVRFLQEDFEGALEDIEITLTLEPDHFGALSGKALALLRLGKRGLAKLAVVRAIQVHPWLNERSLLGDGEDI